MSAGTDFAALGPDLLAPDESAPYGYTIDSKTGERRPKKRAGRPPSTPRPDSDAPRVDGRPPSLEELRAAGPRARTEDREPAAEQGRGRRSHFDASDLPPFRAGPIAKGMNKLYLRAGKILRAFDPELGMAVILTTRKEAEDDVTVGEAWEELARTNPRIRAVLLKLITGGAWSQLVMAHAPILLALLLKEAIARRFPLGRFVSAWMEPDGAGDQFAQWPATAEDWSEPFGPPEGMTGEDVAQAMAFAQQMAANMMNGMGRMPSAPRAPVVDAPAVPIDDDQAAA